MPCNSTMMASSTITFGSTFPPMVIAGVLVLNLDVFILDEPNEGIQPNRVQLIRDVLLKMNREQGMRIMLVEQ